MRLQQTDAFQALLLEPVKIHGHLCPGQVLGIRMALLGLKETGIEDPKGKDKKGLIVFVEMDRCATDAIQSVTGCSLGQRTLKFMDFGKMAATFLNLRTGKAIRIVAREEAREKTKAYFPGIKDKYLCQMEAYKIMPDDELFSFEPVRVDIPQKDMPGKPRNRIRCGSCGEYVQDRREVMLNGKVLCKACAYGRYYTSQEMNLDEQ